MSYGCWVVARQQADLAAHVQEDIVAEVGMRGARPARAGAVDSNQPGERRPALGQRRVWQPRVAVRSGGALGPSEEVSAAACGRAVQAVPAAGGQVARAIAAGDLARVAVVVYSDPAVHEQIVLRLTTLRVSETSVNKSREDSTRRVPL